MPDSPQRELDMEILARPDEDLCSHGRGGRLAVYHRISIGVSPDAPAGPTGAPAGRICPNRKRCQAENGARNRSGSGRRRSFRSRRDRRALERPAHPHQRPDYRSPRDDPSTGPGDCGPRCQVEGRIEGAAVLLSFAAAGGVGKAGSVRDHDVASRQEIRLRASVLRRGPGKIRQAAGEFAFHAHWQVARRCVSVSLFLPCRKSRNQRVGDALLPGVHASGSSWGGTKPAHRTVFPR